MDTRRKNLLANKFTTWFFFFFFLWNCHIRMDRRPLSVFLSLCASLSFYVNMLGVVLHSGGLNLLLFWCCFLSYGFL